MSDIIHLLPNTSRKNKRLMLIYLPPVVFVVTLIVTYIALNNLTL